MNSRTSVITVFQLFALYTELYYWNSKITNSGSAEAQMYETVYPQHLLEPLVVTLFSQLGHWRHLIILWETLNTAIFFNKTNILGLTKAAYFSIGRSSYWLFLSVSWQRLILFKNLLQLGSLIWLSSSPQRRVQNDLLFFGSKVQEWNRAL